VPDYENLMVEELADSMA
jgi:hypothetical protein